MFEKLIWVFLDILIFLLVMAYQNWKYGQKCKDSQNFDFEPPKISKKIKITEKAQFNFWKILVSTCIPKSTNTISELQWTT